MTKTAELQLAPAPVAASLHFNREAKGQWYVRGIAGSLLYVQRLMIDGNADRAEAREAAVAWAEQSGLNWEVDA